MIISAGRGRTLWHLRSLTPFGAFRIDKPAPRKWWYRILLVVCLCSKKVGDSSVSSTSTTVGDGRLRLRKSDHDDVIVSRDHARDVLDRMATRFATQQVLELPIWATRCSGCSCSLAVLDPRVGHTMDVLSPFIPVLCHSD